MGNKMEFAKEKLSTIIAIVGITIIELYALHCGIDGVALSTSVGIIAGLGGYALQKGGNHE